MAHARHARAGPCMRARVLRATHTTRMWVFSHKMGCDSVTECICERECTQALAAQGRLFQLIIASA
eukprot:9096075-Alexandrium_andersonii.AAC.1